MPRHDLDVLSLVAGIAFSGAALVALLDQGLDVPARWALPILLIVVGLAGLLASAGRSTAGSHDNGGDVGGESPG